MPVRPATRAVLLVVTLLMALGLLLAITWCSGSSAPSPRPGRAPEADAGQATASSSGTTDRRDEVAGPREVVVPTAVDPEASPPVVAASLGTLHLRARWASDDIAAAGIDVNVAPLQSPVRRVDEHSSVTDAGGEATFADLPPGRYRVYRSGRNLAEADVTAGDTAEVELVLDPGFAVVGHVVDPSGVPVAEARIWLAQSHVGHGWDHGRVVTVSDASGAFTLFHVDEIRMVAALAPGRAPSRRYEVSGASGANVPLTIVVGPRGGVVRGSVRDSSGQRLADCAVFVGPQRGYGEVRIEDGFASVDPAPVMVRTDRDGRFEAHGVSPGDLLVSVPAPPSSGLAPGRVTLALHDDELVEIDVVLELGWSVEGVVRTSSSEPLAGAVVAVRDHERFPYLEPIRADTLGRYRLRGLPAGSVGLTASGVGVGQAVVTLDGQPGQVVRWDPILGAGGTVTGRVLDEHDAPLSGWRVCATAVEAPWENAFATTADDGRFAIAGLANTTQRLLVAAGPREPVRLVVEPVQPGGAELTLRVAAASAPSAFVRGRAIGRDGAGAKASHVTLSCAALHWSAEADVDPTSGGFELGPLPPGEYAGRIESTLHTSLRIPAFWLAAGERRDLGVLPVARGGDLVVDLTPQELVPQPASGQRLNASVYDLDGREVAICFREGSEARPLSPLPAGDYTVGVYGDGVAALTLPCTLIDGQTTRATVHLERAASCTFAITLAPALSRNQSIDLTVMGIDGTAPVLRVRLHAGTVDRWQTPFAAGLPPGRYLVTATAESGARAAAPLTMGSRDVQVPLPLR